MGVILGSKMTPFFMLRLTPDGLVFDLAFFGSQDGRQDRPKRVLGGVLSRLGGLRGSLGGLRDHLGEVLGRFWALLGPLGIVNGRFWIPKWHPKRPQDRL